MSFDLDAALFEGLGGSLLISSSVESIGDLEKATTSLNRMFKSISRPVEINLILTGSGFRVQFETDKVFQHGFSLHIQLGSKKAIVRVPYEIISVTISGGRNIKILSFKNSNLLNFADFIKSLAPFKEGKGIQQSNINSNIFSSEL